MTFAESASLVGILVAAVGSIGAAAVAVITAMRTQVIVTKVEQVHVLTNRNFSEQKALIADLQAEVGRLKVERAEKKVQEKE